MKIAAQNARDHKPERVLEDIDGGLVLEVILDNIEDATGRDLPTLDHIEHNVGDLLPVQAAFDLVKSNLKSLQGHLGKAELGVGVAAVIDQEAVDFGALGANKLWDSCLLHGC